MSQDITIYLINSANDHNGKGWSRYGGKGQLLYESGKDGFVTLNLDNGETITVPNSNVAMIKYNKEEPE